MVGAQWNNEDDQSLAKQTPVRKQLSVNDHSCNQVGHLCSALLRKRRSSVCQGVTHRCRGGAPVSALAR